MLDLIPPTPDAATLHAMTWWAAGGAALAFGSIAIRWLWQWVRPVPAEATLHIPGAPKTAEPAPAPWAPAALWAVIVFAALGAVAAWGWYGPEDVQKRIGMIFAIIGMVQAVRQVLRVVRDTPAVGEPPPDDPDRTVAARLPGAVGGVALACLGTVMALF